MLSISVSHCFFPLFLNEKIFFLPLSLKFSTVFHLNNRKCLTIFFSNRRFNLIQINIKGLVILMTSIFIYSLIFAIFRRVIVITCWIFFSIFMFWGIWSHLFLSSLFTHWGIIAFYLIFSIFWCIAVTIPHFNFLKFII